MHVVTIKQQTRQSLQRQVQRLRQLSKLQPLPNLLLLLLWRRRSPPVRRPTYPLASDRPKTKAFGEQEGGVSGQEGTLGQGDGYSLYVFQGFTLDSQSGRLSLTEDPTYYAEIEHLPAGYDLTALKQQGQTELSAIGKANDHSGELIEHPLGFAELYLQATSDKGIEDYMVWKNQAGEAFLFRIHNPKGDSSNNFAPWVMVSLATLELERN